LAGSLGSFGLLHGSALARQLEERLGAAPRPERDAELTELASALRREIRR